MNVDLCGGDVFVAEPEGYDRGFDARVQQPHCGRVAHDVGGYFLFAQRRAGSCGGGGVLGDGPFRGGAGEGGAAPGGEQRVGGQPAAFGQPCLQHADGAAGQRGDPLFAALPGAADVRAGAQVGIADGQGDQLGGAQPGLAGQCQQGVVAPPGPGGAVGGGQQRGDLVFGEVGDQGAVAALGRDGQHAGDDRGVVGVAQRGVAEQRVDGGQAGVAGGGAVTAHCFQVVQEPTDQRGVQVGDRQLAWRLAQLAAGEPQDELPGVAVGGDGVAAGLPLGDQPVGEECLQGGGQGAHECPARCASRRWPAIAISSGAADRYQNVCLGSV